MLKHEASSNNFNRLNLKASVTIGENKSLRGPLEQKLKVISLNKIR